MKLLIIQGSYHKNGTIVSLIKQAAAGFKSISNKNTVEIINLDEANINFCKGCMACGRNNIGKPYGICPQNDDMQNILNKMYNADRIIIASPVYFIGTTALTKRFIERCIALSYYAGHSWPKPRNKLDKNKKGFVIVSTDCPAPFNRWLFLTIHPIYVLKSVIKMAGFGNIKSLAASTFHLEKFQKKAFEIGKKMGV